MEKCAHSGEKFLLGLDQQTKATNFASNTSSILLLDKLM